MQPATVAKPSTSGRSARAGIRCLTTLLSASPTSIGPSRIAVSSSCWPDSSPPSASAVPDTVAPMRKHVASVARRVWGSARW